jgi:hypothetical protein
MCPRCGLQLLLCKREGERERERETMCTSTQILNTFTFIINGTSTSCQPVAALYSQRESSTGVLYVNLRMLGASLKSDKQYAEFTPLSLREKTSTHTLFEREPKQTFFLPGDEIMMVSSELSLNSGSSGSGSGTLPL